MPLWDIVWTEEFLTALAKLPKSQTFTDVMAELFERLRTNAGEGDVIGNGDLRVVKSNPKAGHLHPAISVLYRIDLTAQRVVLIDVKPSDELPSGSRPPLDLHA